MKKTGFVSNLGAQIYFEQVGCGQAIILLHGNRQTHRVFKEQVAFLSQSYQVILPDSRGHGHSQMGDEDLNLSLMAQDVHALVKHLHLGKVILFGFSDGANIALKYASSYPEQVESVVAVSPNAHPSGLKKWFHWSILGMGMMYSLLETIKLPVRKLHQITQLMLVSDQLTGEELAKIQAPVLIFTGKQDIIKLEHILEMSRKVPNAMVMNYENAGHLTLFKDSGKYMEEVEKFLNTKGKLDER